MVTIGIMVVMSGVLLAYNHSTDTQLALSVGSARIVGFLSRAKSYALEKRDLGLGPNTLVCAYGVHFANATVSGVQTPQMTIFGTVAGSGEDCTTAQSDSGFGRLSGSGAVFVESLQLDPRLSFNFSNSPTDIAFVPPYLSTYFDGNPPGPNGYRTVTLDIAADPTKNLGVEVGPGGDISQP